MVGKERLEELADFLKTRRARLKPKDVGLPSTGRRRTAGLRREEVAELAGISSTWYTWLEQGRQISVSQRTGNMIASALRLNDSERAHFFKLIKKQLTNDFSSTSAESIDYELQSILHCLQYHPAFALNHRWDLLSWNDAANLIFKFHESPENFIRFIFSSQHFRAASFNWETDVRGILAQFRLDYDQYAADDPALEELIDSLLREIPEFHSLWREHDVIQRTGWSKQLLHPQIGELTFKSVVFERTSTSFPRVVIYVPDSESLKKIESSRLVK